jgi:hypothetical protein
MPLPRIITKSADDSLELSMQLRSRGFRVETVAPDQIPGVPADLEVCLEECAPEDVLTKAAVVQESEDLWVFVAPGALDERPRPIRVIPLTPQVVEFRTPEHVAAVAALAPKVEAAAVEVQLPQVERKTPVVEVQLPAVLVKEVVLAPEDDPILCELESHSLAATDSATLRMEAIRALTSGVIAEPPVVAPAETEIAVPVLVPIEAPKTAPAPVEVKAPPQIESTPSPHVNDSLERVRHLAVVQQMASPIPEVPERIEPRIVLYKPAPPKTKRLGPRRIYKVAFQSGPKLWRAASVTFALLVLAGLVATVIAVHPTLPKKDITNPNQAIFLPAAQAATAVSGDHTAASIPSPVAPKSAASHATSRRRSASDDGIVAQDTVVFYDRKPAPPREAKLPPPPSGVKRYSDAN